MGPCKAQIYTALVEKISAAEDNFRNYLPPPRTPREWLTAETFERMGEQARAAMLAEGAFTKQQFRLELRLLFPSHYLLVVLFQS